MMENEVACLDITPLGPGKAHFVAAGLWTDVSALILTVPSLDIVTKETMKGGKSVKSPLLRLHVTSFLSWLELALRANLNCQFLN